MTATIRPTTTIAELLALAGVEMGNVSQIELDPFTVRITSVLKRHSGGRVTTDETRVPIKTEGFK